MTAQKGGGRFGSSADRDASSNPLAKLAYLTAHGPRRGRVHIDPCVRTGADLQLRVYPGHRGLPRPSQLAIDHVSLVGCAAAGRCLELGQLAETRARAVAEQGHWTPGPVCPRWTSKLFLAQSELGSIRLSRIVGPGWLAQAKVLDRRGRSQPQQGLV